MKQNLLIWATTLLLSACWAPSEKTMPVITDTVADSVARPLSELQQQFLNLRFGMFIHFNMPTYSTHDWPDPETPPSVFNPIRLDCEQWADAAVSAGMTYGCLTTKHHTGFCIWNTKTTDYSVMNSPLNRDVVREYVDAFRKRGLKVCLYYSILDIHHNIRAGWANARESLPFIKAQLTELLTNYGEITCLLFDGWDAEWSRLSYEDIPFDEIYNHVKSLQPNCLVSEHNAGKYPVTNLFYTDLKHYEQNAGQLISKETNCLPAQAGIPINKYWFWRENYPESSVVSVEEIVEKNLKPLNEAHCNFILNVAPNREGLIDGNVLAELRKVGQVWQHPGAAPLIGAMDAPVIANNLAKRCRMNSSWALGKRTSDLASDDDFTTCWVGQDAYKEHFIEVILTEPTDVNALCIVEGTDTRLFPQQESSRIGSYDICYYDGKQWTDLNVEPKDGLVRLHRFTQVRAEKIRVNLHDCKKGTGIAELMVYHENN